MTQIRIVVVDDHAILRVGLKMLINSQPDMEVVGEADSAADALVLLAKIQPDIAILDIALPHTSGLQLLKELRTRYPSIRVLMLTMHTDVAFVRSALSEGASGFVLKQGAGTDLLSALRAAARGGTFVDPSVAGQVFSTSASGRNRSELLSDRERQVLKLLAQGFGNQEISKRLFVSVKTVESYRARIAEKLQLKTRSEMTRYALATGLLTLYDAMQKDDPAA